MVEFKAKDGHNLDSEYEVRVDNLLSWYELPHRVHSPIPGYGNHTADFIVADVFVEIWGKDDEKYNSDREQKERFYRIHKMKLVGFEKEDFADPMKLHKKITEIQVKKQGRQTNVIKKQKDEYQEPVDIFTHAEKHAKEEGALDEVEREIKDKEAKLEELNKKREEIKDELNKLNENRTMIIRSYYFKI